MNGRTLIEVRHYRLVDPDAAGKLAARLGEAVVQARADIGLYASDGDPSSIVAITEHVDFDGLAATEALLATDEQTPCETVDVSLLRLFAATPKIERRFSGNDRVYQLRIYEHPHSSAGETKIEMFETEEIEIFRRVGLNPVFFGQAIAGANLPNLTYLLGFDDAERRRQAWSTFVDDPAWKRLSSVPRYADARVIRRITNINLTPLPGSTF